MSELSKVFIDSEDVVFSGAAPENLAVFTNIVFGLIEEQRRYVVSFTVDGAPVHESMLNKGLDNFKEIRIETALQREFFLKLIEQQCDLFKGLVEARESYFLPILCKPFSEFGPNIDSFFLQISPILETLQSFKEYAEKHNPEWTDELTKVEAGIDSNIETFLSFAKDRDVGGLAESAGYSLLPSLVRALKLFKETIKPYFEAFPI